MRFDKNLNHQLNSVMFSFQYRFWPLSTAFAIIVLILIPFTAIAQAAKPENPLAKAQTLQAEGKTQAAINAYTDVSNSLHGKNDALASQALYDAGQLAATAGKNPAERNAFQQQAYQLFQQLENEFPNTKAVAQLKQSDAIPNLITQIDQYNSHDWKYKLINALVNVTGRVPAFSYAFSMLLLAVLVRLLLTPLTKKQYASMRDMQRLQPLIKELQSKYKGADLGQKQMDLFKEHGINPFGSCLPMLLQIPFLILIYTAIEVYRFAFMKGTFLWIGSPLDHRYPGIVAANLGMPDIPLLVIYTASNYLVMRLTPVTDPNQAEQQKTMALISSLIFFYMFWRYQWPSAFLLYWLALNVITMVQQYYYMHRPLKQQAALEAANSSAASATISRNGAKAETPSPVVETVNPSKARPRKRKR
ncbi:MAG: YidC/Oxa1 family membrane protein insertase [Armatimonadetes bacterium]|nr:YidC/Oxa1 family membrane protein insertase [Armatimonadota bacterium]